MVEGDEMMALVGYWVPNLYPHSGILYRNGVEDPSTQEFNKGVLHLEGMGCFDTIQGICRGTPLYARFTPI